MGSLFGNIVRSVGGGLAKVGRLPGVGAIPGVGTALSVLGVGSTLYGLAKGGSSSSSQLPAFPGTGGAGILATPKVGQRGIFQNDPNIIKALQGFAISKANLRQCYRAPKGFVVLHDENGDAFGLPKELARKFYGWKSSPKPFLTATDMKAIRRTNSVMNKFKKIEKTLKKVGNFHAPKQRMKEIIIQKRKAA